MRKAQRNRERSWFMILPLYLFTVVFVAVPLLYIVILSFLQRDVTWGVTSQVTINNYIKMLDPVYLKTFGESIRLALTVTLIALVLGYPYGYFLARLSPKWRGILLLLLIVPFWTNSLVRIYGWMILLRNNGLVNQILVAVGLFEKPVRILYTYNAVLVGMVYALLPFMILPVYSSVEKMDWSVVEAARDLGAGRAYAFLTVTLKLTLPGILSGVVLVFIPSIGLFFISDLMGGGKIMLVGNLIQNQLLTARDWPFGAALSLVLMVLTTAFIGLYRKVSKVKELEGL